MNTPARTTRTSATLRKINSLEKEVSSLRSLVYGIVAADKSRYKPSFVRLVKSRATQKPVKTFVTGADFLEDVKRA